MLRERALDDDAAPCRRDPTVIPRRRVLAKIGFVTSLPGAHPRRRGGVSVSR